MRRRLNDKDRLMVIAYHAIFTTYGTWLPNDPRGSYSKAVYNEELQALGDVLYGRQMPPPDGHTLRRFRTAAVPTLSRPPYSINDATRPLVGAAFGEEIDARGLKCAECAIMNDHVHIILFRSTHRIEYLVNQLKGAGTRALGETLTPWTRGGWKVFLDDTGGLAAAIKYVRANPPAAGLPPQHWDFVKPVTYDDVL
jgi:REP element-mobilizing transposase RayT